MIRMRIGDLVMSTLARLFSQFRLLVGDWIAASAMAATLAVIAVWKLRDAPLRSHWIKHAHMPIENAGLLMYNRSGAALRRFAINEAGRASFSRPSKYYEGCLIVAARQGIITMYGARQPRLMHEQIPADYLDGVYEARDGNFASFFDHDRIDWYEVRVSRSDARKALREFEIDEVKLRLA